MRVSCGVLTIFAICLCAVVLVQAVDDHSRDNVDRRSKTSPPIRVRKCWQFPNCHKCFRMRCTKCYPGYRLQRSRSGYGYSRRPRYRWTCVRKPQINLCAGILCRVNTQCKVVNRRARCVPICRRACPRIYKPVCGSDGKTYANKCVLDLKSCQKNTNITVAYEGRCKSQVCQRFRNCYRCTQQQCTQCNPGFYKMQGRLRGRYYCTRKCPRGYVPRNGMCVRSQACGGFPNCYRCTRYHCTQCTQGYYLMPRGPKGRQCVMNCLGGYQARAGKCYLITPVNQCASIQCFGNTQCKLVNGKPRCVKMCPKICTKEYAPVCGTDNKTYGNECTLRASACINNSYISVAYRGACRRPPPPQPIG